MVDVIVEALPDFTPRLLGATLLGCAESHFLRVVVLPFCLIVCPVLGAFWVMSLRSGLAPRYGRWGR